GTATDEEGETRHGGYCTTFRGQQHILAAGPDDAPTGPTYLAALEAFRQTLQLETADQAGGKNTLRVVAERFLSWCQVNKKPKTLKMYTECLLPLCNFRQRPGDPLFGELTL